MQQSIFHDRGLMRFRRGVVLIILFSTQPLLLCCKQKDKAHNTSNTIKFKSVRPDSTSLTKDSALLRGYFVNRFAYGYSISLIELISNPNLYDGKRVMVTGFLNIAFEESTLYVSETDALHGIGLNGVHILLEDERDYHKLSASFNTRYVTVNGVFAKDETGHMGANSGGLRDISRVILD